MAMCWIQVVALDATHVTWRTWDTAFWVWIFRLMLLYGQNEKPLRMGTPLCSCVPICVSWPGMRGTLILSLMSDASTVSVKMIELLTPLLSIGYAGLG